MDVEKLFHMTGGIGRNSYAQNSSFQKKASDMVKHITTETIQDVYLELAPGSLGIADLGCSSGPNTLSFIKEMVGTVETASCKAMRQPPDQYWVYLNDLPTNDFNSIFKCLPDLYRELKNENGSGCSIFVAGYPGSFYGRLFPGNCLHFVYASYSLHWLSRVPPALYDKQGRSRNKGKVYISETSPPLVPQAYESQFREDFSQFLQLRSKELVPGGRMVLILLGRIGPEHVDRGNSFYWELLSRSFAILVSQGVIDEEKLDSYDMHFYAPSREEIEAEISRNGSLAVNRLEMFETQKDGYRVSQNYGAEVAMTVRAIQEPMIRHHFGEEILDILFQIYGRMVDEEMAKEEIRPITFVLALRKL